MMTGLTNTQKHIGVNESRITESDIELSHFSNHALLFDLDSVGNSEISKSPSLDIQRVVEVMTIQQNEEIDSETQN